MVYSLIFEGTNEILRLMIALTGIQVRAIVRPIHNTC